MMPAGTKRTKTIEVAYSYRMYEQKELEVPVDLDLNDEAAVLAALPHSFSEDEEVELDWAEVVED
jgi:hypothetical protein